MEKGLFERLLAIVVITNIGVCIGVDVGALVGRTAPHEMYSRHWGAGNVKPKLPRMATQAPARPKGDGREERDRRGGGGKCRSANSLSSSKWHFLLVCHGSSSNRSIAS